MSLPAPWLWASPKVSQLLPEAVLRVYHLLCLPCLRPEKEMTEALFWAPTAPWSSLSWEDTAWLESGVPVSHQM